jgi:serine/threonine protein kinase
LNTLKFEDDNQIKKNSILSTYSDDSETSNKKRGYTFCGTAEYVSPEMLLGEMVDYGSDYWAFGCIIYFLITGSSPFKDKSQYLTFQNIKNLAIPWPKAFDIEAKDLILKLLAHKPDERLGYYSFKDLISHAFFKTEDGDCLYDFIFSTEIPNKNCLNTKSKRQKLEDERLKNQKEKLTKPIKLIKEQLVEKKSPYLHYNSRKLVLDSTPKLDYCDPKTGKVKGEIYLSEDCEAIMESTSKFNLNTPKRIFIFKVPNEEAGIWCKLINEQIELLKK